MSYNAMELNYLAILGSVIFNFILGFLWYSKILFGESWIKEVGIDPNSIDKKEAMKGFALGTFSSVFIFFIIALIMQIAHIKCWSNGASIGFLLAMLVIFQMITNFSYEGRSRKLFLINASFVLVTYIIGGAIIGSW
jgi:hypothetical protein